MLQSELPVANAIPPVIQPYQTQRFLSSIIATEEQVLKLIKALISLRHVAMMGLVIRLLSYAVRVLIFILLTLLTCLFHLVNTRANGSLQMLFLCLKITIVNSKRITILFLSCPQTT